MTQDPYEIAQNVLQYGLSRYEANAEKFLLNWDNFFGINPEIGKTERKQRTAERVTLFQIDKRGAANHADFLAGLKGLLEKGDIRRKTRGGWTLTPQGRKRLKEIDRKTNEIIGGN